MTAAVEERVCADTGLWLVAASGETAFRVAKDRGRGVLSGWPNALIGPPPVGADSGKGDPRGRYDTIGSTIYFADSRRCAYAEVLVGFRQKRASIAKLADTIGWNVDEYIAHVKQEALNNGVDLPWAIPVDWQMDRSINEIRMPGNGWWVQIDHANSMSALEYLTPKLKGMNDQLQLLTSGTLGSDDRAITTLLAHCIRDLTLDDGTTPLGISYASKTLVGRCWAYWDRRADEGLPPGHNDLVLLTSENVGPDPDFEHIADLYGLPILGARGR